MNGNGSMLRNSLTFLIAGLVLVVLTDPLAAADKAGKLDPAEQSTGFESLFDGQSLQGWKQNGNWKVEEGAMVRAAGGGGISYQTKKVPDDFDLRFEWKVGPGSNSGIYYRPGQYEYQILDNQKHADGKNPRTSAASLYFCMAPSHDATRKPGEWNTGRIVCHGSVIQHWLNGKKVIDFDYADERWADEVELLRLRGGKLASRGAFLSLQDHGDPVAYRNIRIRELPSEFELERSDVKPAEIPADVHKAEQAKLQRILESREKSN